MDELENLPLAHFSKKILFFSFLFLALNFAFFTLFFYGQGRPSYRVVSPQLIFAGHQKVTLKTTFDSDFMPATSDQVIRSGTEIKTGPESFAELKLEGNTLRLDQNTHITLDENRFENPSFLVRPEDPRLSFTINSGSVWLSAHEGLLIRTPLSQVTFAHAVGSVTYASPMNRVMVVTGGADLALKNQNGDVMTRYFIPFRHQVAFVDSQITKSYARLQASKLKKELKLAPLSEALLEDDWIRRNQDQDLSFLASEKKAKSYFAYRFLDSTFSALHRLAFLPEAKRQFRLARLENHLQFLLSSRGDETEADVLLQKMDSFTRDLEKDPEFFSLFAREFYRMGTVPFDSTAFRIKEKFRMAILQKEENPLFLRTYLGDIAWDLREGKTEAVLSQLELWRKTWEAQGMAKHFQEFENQSRLVHSLLLAYPEAVPSGFLDFLNPLAEFREVASPDKKETLFLIAEERLELASALIANAHYRVAKAYLQAGYFILQKKEFEAEESARDVMLERVELLNERIAFAEEELHSAAEPIDEIKFRDYLERKVRDETLSLSLQSFLESPKEETLTPPPFEKVMERFAEARISVIAEDLEGNPDSPFEFIVKSARLFDRGSETSSIFFTAIYDYRTNAVHEIKVSDKLFKGNFELKDLVTVLTESEERVPKKPTSLSLLMDFDPSLFAETNDDANRAQMQAQDLARQVVLEAFKKAGIELALNSIDLLNFSTLDQFKINEVQLKNPQNLKQTVSLTFDFNLSTKKVTGARLLQKDTPLPASVPLDELSSVVFATLNGVEQKKNLLEAVSKELKSKGLLISQDKLQVETGERLRFTGLSVPNLPLEVSGIYDHATQRFAEVSHELLQKTDASIEDYFNELARLFTLSYLEGKGIEVPPEQLFLSFPFDKIAVKNFTAGKSLLDFEVNLKAGRLEKILIQGSDSPLDQMTFEEFKGVLKTFQESQ